MQANLDGPGIFLAQFAGDAALLIARHTRETTGKIQIKAMTGLDRGQP